MLISFSYYKNRGFTLIELIVTVALLSLLTGIGYQVMQMAIQSKNSVQQQSKTLREFELGLFLLKTDLQQIQMRPIPAGELPFMGYPIANDKNGAEDGQHLFAFYHSPETLPVSDIVKTIYQFDNEQLIQTKIIDNEEYQTVIIDNINELRIGYQATTGEQTNSWANDTLPAQINISFVHQRLGTLTLQYQIAL